MVSQKVRHTGERDCVVIALCHCETPLRRCVNLMFPIDYEIALLITFARKDIMTQSLRHGSLKTVQFPV